MRMRTASLGDVMCPDGSNAPTISDCAGGYSGYYPGDTSIPQAPGSVLNCSFGYVEVNGECLPVPYSVQPLPPTMNPAPSPTIPAPIYPSPSSACPNGMMLLDNAVCVPNSSPAAQQQNKHATGSIIPGVPDWMIYGIGSVLALMMFSRGGGRR
jgi:hypothetical protein